MAADSIFVMIEEDLIDDVEEKLDAGEFDVNELDEVNSSEHFFYFALATSNPATRFRIVLFCLYYYCMHFCQISLHNLNCLVFVVVVVISFVVVSNNSHHAFVAITYRKGTRL